MRVVYNVPLIPQCNTRTCWYSCMLMIVRWKNQGSGFGYAGPSAPDVLGADLDTPEVAAEVCGNNVYVNLATPEAIQTIADLLNLQTVYATLTADGLAEVLRDHGPVIYAGRAHGYRGITTGTAHGIVIRGIDGDTVFINDPAPPGAGLQLDMNYATLLRELPTAANIPLLHA